MYLYGFGYAAASIDCTAGAVLPFVVFLATLGHARGLRLGWIDAWSARADDRRRGDGRPRPSDDDLTSSSGPRA